VFCGFVFLKNMVKLAALFDAAGIQNASAKVKTGALGWTSAGLMARKKKLEFSNRNRNNNKKILACACCWRQAVWWRQIRRLCTTRKSGLAGRCRRAASPGTGRCRCAARCCRCKSGAGSAPTPRSSPTRITSAFSPALPFCSGPSSSAPTFESA
jgi:hypothetical protein